MHHFISYLQQIKPTNMWLLFVGLIFANYLGGMETQTITDFPTKYAHLSGTIMSMAKDTEQEGGTIKIPLPSSQETIADVFTLFEKYNPEGLQDKIRDEIASYSLHKLVSASNLLQHLQVPEDMIEIILDQVATILNDMLIQLLHFLNEYIYDKNKKIIMPYYESLKNLNPDVEQTIKEKLFRINTTLLWNIEEIWKTIGIENSKIKSELEQDNFKKRKEKMIFFLDRNVFIPVLQFIEENQKKRLSNKVFQDNNSIDEQVNNQSFGSGITYFAAVAMAKLRQLYNYYVAQ